MKSRFFKKLAALALAFVLLLPLLAVAGNPATAEPVSVTAEETVAETEDVVLPETDGDELFDFAPGASVRSDLSALCFGIYQTDTEYDGRMNYTGECSILRFTLYYYNASLNKSSAKCEIVIFSQRVSVSNARIRTRVYVLAKEIEKDPGVDISSVIIYPDQLVEKDVTYESDFEHAKDCDNEFLINVGLNGYKVLKEGIRWTDPQGASEPHCDPFEFDDSEGSPLMRIYFSPSSFTSSYFVEAEYAMAFYDYGLTNTIGGSLTSPARSVYDYINAANEKGILKDLFFGEDLVRAQAILNQASAPKEISLHYLEEIPGTYFAVERTATISVPIIDGVLANDDVKEALKKKTLRVQNAYVEGFESNADQTEWTARYYNSVHLRTKTVDGAGHYIDMFLDLNKSYGDYYGTLASTIADGAGLYSYMWNEFLLEYPILESDEYNPDNVHGFFGVVWIPERSAFASFNAAAAKLFNVKNEEFGFIKAFKGTRSITYKEHEALMTKYNYSWMATAWEAVVDFVTLENVMAEYYFFAAKPMSYTAISKTGDASEDDDDGVLENVARDPLGSVGDLLGDFFGLGDGVGGVVKRVSSLIVVGVVAFAIVYLVMYVKSGGLTGQGSKKNGKKKK